MPKKKSEQSHIRDAIDSVEKALQYLKGPKYERAARALQCMRQASKLIAEADALLKQNSQPDSFQFLVEDSQGRLAKVFRPIDTLPLAVMAAARSIFSIDSGVCLKYIDSPARPHLKHFLENRGLALDNLPKAEPLVLEQTTPGSRVKPLYAFANPNTGFYCGAGSSHLNHRSCNSSS